MKEIKFNPRQVEFIRATEDQVVVTAPPGSGKTLSIVGAVKEYRKNYPTHHVVAITYTRKATEELRNRINDRQVEVSTIHSWSYRQLQKYANKYEFSVEMLDDDTIKDILQRLCRKRRQYNLNKFQLYHFVMGNYNIDIDDSIKRLFMTIAADYQRYKRENNLYDFTDLPLYLSDVLDFYKETITEIDAIFIDEFQDVDPVQVAIFNRVLSKKKVYIGDPRQSIYIFRQSIENLEEVTEGFAPYTLDTNYRSYQEIIDYAEWARQECEMGIANSLDYNFAVDLDDYTKTHSQILCQRGNGGKVYMFDTAETGRLILPESQSTNIKTPDVLLRLISDDATQILVRSNKQVKRLEALGMSRVSTIHQAKGLEYKNVIVVGFDITDLEELNIMYVAMTRAMDVLAIIEFEEIKKALARLDFKQPEVMGSNGNVNKLF